VLVTKTDLLAGFNDFFSALDAEQRAQVWGITFDASDATARGPSAVAHFGEEFARLERRIRVVLGPRALRIDHIGSTSVPGLAAKDVIDVQVTVARLRDADPLAAAGFRAQPFVRDHVPPRAPDQEAEWTKRFFNLPEGERRGNVHVRVAGRANQRYALLFRDYLREHPAAAEAYGRLKVQLAKELEDPAAYPYVKDPACDLIWVAAEEWAAATGWMLQPPTSRASSGSSRVAPTR
jgi:GrpB-like predicted nucleotidyltransferase (UPF0157 family)